MLQIVARAVLPHSGHIVEDGSIGKNCFEAYTIGMERVVPDEVDTSSICCEVAANIARSFGSEVDRHHMVPLFDIILKV